MTVINREALLRVLEACEQNGFTVIRLATDMEESKPPEVQIVLRQTIPVKKEL